MSETISVDHTSEQRRKQRGEELGLGVDATWDQINDHTSEQNKK